MPPKSLIVGQRRLIDLSGLVHNLNVVTVGVEYPSCVIVRVILELRCRCSFLPSACCNCTPVRIIRLCPRAHAIMLPRSTSAETEQ